jgi:signal transduction histidine kinase
VTTSDLLSIAAIAGACALLVGAIGAGTLRLLRRRSIVIQLAVVAIGAVATTLAGITGVAAAMFVSSHDFTVVVYVCAISGLVATLLSLELSRRIVRSSRELTTATRRLGEGDEMLAETTLKDRPHGSELSELAGELSTASAKLTRHRERERIIESSRRELIAWISQDLRAPLTGLLTLTEALEGGMVADVNRAHKQLRLDVDRITDMADDLVELSHIHTETPHLSRRHVVLHDAVSEAIANVGPAARARATEIESCDIADVTVSADYRQLVRALSNVLLSAIRHTPADGIVKVGVDSGNNGGATIWITDGCDGNLPEDLDRVFDTTWRGDRSVAANDAHVTANRLVDRKRPSVPRGMAALKGMANVKDSVEASGGQILVMNVSGSCRFEIALPLAIEPLTATTEQDAP